MNYTYHPQTRPKAFDRNRPPKKPNMFLMAGLVWPASFLITAMRRLKVHKTNMKGFKPPYIVLSNHMAFADFFGAFRVLFPHRACFLSDIEGFIGLEFLCRRIGMFNKRRFTNDFSVIRNIKYALHKLKRSVVIYPEARYSNVGTGSEIPEALAKLIKIMEVPVVTIHQRGNYLFTPYWNLKKRKKARMEVELSGVLTAEEVKKLTVEQIYEKITPNFVYNEYEYQREREIAIDDPWRAEGLHLVLYRCPHCGTEYETASEGSRLHCRHCGKTWELTELGELKALEGETEFNCIPDWFDWERECVREEILRGDYHCHSPMRIDALINSKGMIDLGPGELWHDRDGLRLEFMEFGEKQTINFPTSTLMSLYNEYDYRGQGACISLAKLDETWYVYPKSPTCNVTKLRFAAEELHKEYVKALGKKAAG
jgi:1-acyl-sn-glycerol-3-phosphate acyltransferase